MSRRPLEGIKVVEFGQNLAGPYAGQILAFFAGETLRYQFLIASAYGIADEDHLWHRLGGRLRMRACAGEGGGERYEAADKWAAVHRV